MRSHLIAIAGVLGQPFFLSKIPRPRHHILEPKQGKAQQKQRKSKSNLAKDVPPAAAACFLWRIKPIATEKDCRCVPLLLYFFFFYIFSCEILSVLWPWIFLIIISYFCHHSAVLFTLHSCRKLVGIGIFS